MAKLLFRVAAFAAASATALGLFAITRAAPTPGPAPGPRPEASAPAYVVAAMTPPAGDGGLEADADAAGDTGRIGRPEIQGRQAFSAEPAPAAAPPPFADRQDDPIGDLAASPPARPLPAPAEAQAAPLDLPYDQQGSARPRPARQTPAPRRPATPRRHHPHPVSPPKPVLDAPAPAAPTDSRHVVAASAPAPRAVIRPHRLHILVRPPARPILSPVPETAPVTPELPQVEADQAAAPDVETRLRELTRAAADDMRAARFQLSQDLSAGRDGAAVVTLPASVLTRLEADAEDSGLARPGALSITVTLSGDGYAIVPDSAQTSRVTPGQPASFAWRVSPKPGAGGRLVASMTAGLQVDGESRALPLGVLTAELAPPVQAPAPAPAPAAAPQPAPAAATATAPGLGARMRSDLGRLGVPDPSRFRLADLAIPGQPTLDVPGLGEVPSEDVVSAGLLVLALLFLRSLLRGSSARAQRRRRLESFDDPYFRQEHL